MDVVESRIKTVPDGWSLVFGLLLLLAISFPLTGVSTVLSYGAVLVVYAALLLFSVQYISKLAISRVYATLIFLLAGSLILSGLVSPSVGSTIRIGAFFVFTLANLLVLPSVIPFQDLTFLASRYAAGLVVIGFLPYLGVQSLFGVFDLSLWGAYLYLYPELQPITSIFINPNGLGFVLLVGSVAALIEATTTGSRVATALIVVNTTGLLFTNYRTGMVAFAIVLCLAVLYALSNQQTYAVAVAGGLTTFAMLLLAMFGLLPGPVWLTDLSLNGRRILWREAIAVIQQAPLLGFGFGNYTMVVDNPHNSYLRMFLALGVGGGIIYALIVLRSILQATREATDWYSLGISLYLIAFFFVQMMNSLTFIGISFHSVVISLLIGYHIRNDSRVNHEATMRSGDV